MTMKIPDETTADLMKRLRRIEGQVRGIQTMLTEQRECADVVTQIAAASKALEQVGFKLVASGLVYCLKNPEQAAESGYDLDRVEKMFMKIG
jgi:DNA-binding FrmR family transcriptional regulator